MKDHGEYEWTLRMQVHLSSDGMNLSQPQVMRDLLENLKWKLAKQLSLLWN
jgi:hypothetical protein